MEKAVTTTVTFNTNRPVEDAWFYYEDPDTGEESRVSSTSKEYDVGAVIDDYDYPEYDYDSGLVFLGYSTDKDAETADDNIKVTENMQLYGVWGENVTVTYDAGKDEGGYLLVWDDDTGDEVRTYVDEYQTSTGARFYDRTPDNDDPMKTFEGWYDKDGNRWTGESVVTGAMTVYARWSEPEIIDLTEGTAVTVTEADKDTYYRFTVPENGNYRISFSTGDSSYCYIERYNEEFSYTDSDSGHEPVRMLMYDQEKDQISYFKFINEDDEPFSGTAVINKVNIVDVTFHTGNDKAYYENWDEDTQSYKHTDTDVWRCEEGEVICDSNTAINAPNYDETISFLGWSTKPDSSEPDSEIIVGTQPLDVYGVWKIKTPVVFHANNKNAYMDTEEGEEGNLEYIDSLTRYYEKNETIYKWYCNPSVKEDARIRFLGWSTDPEAETPESSIRVTGSAQMDLYAVWQEYYEVTYNANGGYFDEGEDISSQEVDKGDAFYNKSVMNEDPFKVFDGWYDAETGGTKYTAADKITGDLTVYAHWKDAEVSVMEEGVLSPANNSGRFVYSFTPSEDGTYAFNSAEPYNHLPKATLYNSSKEKLAENEQGGYSGNFFLICSLEAGKTYTLVIDHRSLGNADYKIIVRKVDLSTVTYVANHDGAYISDNEGNKVSELTKEYTAGNEISYGIKAQSDSDLLYFRGWSTDQNAKEADDSIYTGNDMTLYAVWEERTRITFHSNNSDIYYDYEEDDEIVYDYDYQENVLIGEVVDRDYEHEFENTAGYTFLGWSTQEGATEAEEITVTADTTDLYAVWKKTSGPDEAIPIALNETKTVNYDAAPVRFSFVPEEDGVYVFESSNNTNDPYGTLYDKDINHLSTSDDSGNGRNFRISRYLEKGAVYYLEAREYTIGNTGTRFDVKVTKPTVITVRFHANDETAAFYDDGTGDNIGKEYTKSYPVGDYISNSTEELDPAYIRNSDTAKEFCGWSTQEGATEADIRIEVTTDLTDLYAVWKPLVNVRFNANSDEALILDRETYTYDKVLSKQLAEGQVIDTYSYDSFSGVPDGKVFMGWADSADATKPSDNIVASNGLELYAVWGDMTVITFDANGGFFDRGDLIRSRAFAPSDEFFSAGTPRWKDDSKVMIGWATTADATNPDVYVEEPVYPGLDTVYAVWADAVTVTYDANGGLVDENGRSSYTDLFRKGSKFINYYAYRNDDDYRFAGWYTEREGGERVYNTVLTDDITVYAHWNKTHEVTMYANGGYFGTPGNTELIRKYADSDIFYPYHNEIPESDDESVVFVGWATKPDAETPDVFPDYTSMQGITEVFAIWQKSVQITLHANGGFFEDTSSDTVSFRVAKGSSLRSIAGYYTAESNDPYKRDDGRRMSATGQVLSGDTVFNTDTELYVKWTELVDLTYDAGNGHISGEDSGTKTVKVAKNETWNVNEYSAVSNEEGIGFLGWSTIPNGSSTVTSITPGSAATLYAVYAAGPEVTLVSADLGKGRISGNVNGQDINTVNNKFIWAKGLKLKDLEISGIANDGYVFLGFSTTQDENGIVSKDYGPSGVTTLYAIFAEGYNVELVAYPGVFPGTTDTYMSKAVRKGEAVGMVEAPVYPEHVLVGWRNYGENTTLSPEELSSYVPESDTELFAIWEEVTVHATGVSLNKTAANILTGKTLQLSAEVSPSDASNKDVIWSSSDTSVAEVDPATGLVTGKKAGTAIITAETADGGFTAACTVKVFNKTKAISGHTYTILSLSSKTVSFTKAKNTATVTVPATVKINGVSFKVTQVGTKAFSGSKIKTITIGSNVTTISSKAFTGSLITKVTNGKSVNKIKASAFYGNSRGKSLTIILKTAKLTKVTTFKSFMKGTRAKTVTIKVSVGTTAANRKTLAAYKKIFTKSNVGFKVTLK